MSGVIDALARLLVDPEARRLPLAPEGIGAAYRLTDEEMRAVAELDPSALEFAAGAIRRKRLARLSAVYPWTVKALRLGSDGALDEFVAGYPPVAAGSPANALESERERFGHFVADRAGPGAGLVTDLFRFEEGKRRLAADAMASGARHGMASTGTRLRLVCQWDVLSTGAALDMVPPRLEPSPGPVRLLMSVDGTAGPATVKVYRLVPRGPG